MPENASRPRVVVTGSTGYLGHYLVRELETRAVEWLTAGRRDCDLTLDLDQIDAICPLLDGYRPEILIHAAALSSLKACDTDLERARRVNVEATARLARESSGRCLFVSTDLVFDGQNAPYGIDDTPRPVNEYGRTKALAEEAVVRHGGRVVRIPLLFGPSFDHRRGATDAIRHATAPVPLFSNEWRTPLHVADAAKRLVDLALAEPTARRASIHHLAGPERVTRLELGQRFLRATRLERQIVPTVCDDPERPRDVSLTGEVVGRSLDAALAES